MGNISSYKTVRHYGEDIENLPIYATITEAQRKWEKARAKENPWRYIEPRILCWAWQNKYINAWDYRFYLNILSKPKPRKLSEWQRNKFKNINTSINVSL